MNTIKFEPTSLSILWALNYCLIFLSLGSIFIVNFESLFDGRDSYEMFMLSVIYLVIISLILYGIFQLFFPKWVEIDQEKITFNHGFIRWKYYQFSEIIKYEIKKYEAIANYKGISVKAYTGKQCVIYVKGNKILVLTSFEIKNFHHFVQCLRLSKKTNPVFDLYEVQKSFSSEGYPTLVFFSIFSILFSYFMLKIAFKF